MGVRTTRLIVDGGIWLISLVRAEPTGDITESGINGQVSLLAGESRKCTGLPVKYSCHNK